MKKEELERERERDREGKSWMDGVTLREDAALRSDQEGKI
jgi:hypothetical protein